MQRTQPQAMTPEVFNWPCGHCGKPTPHHRYPDVEGAPPTECSVCGEQPFAMSGIAREPKKGLTGSYIIDSAVWAIAAFFIGFLILQLHPKLAWLRDLLFNDQI